jgi:type IV secretion system protein VirB9
MRLGFAALACVVLGSAASAETVARAYPEDARIRQYTYDKHQVYRLPTYLRYITAIEFPAGESIDSVQIGDSASWEIVRLDRGNVLTLKPVIEGAYTNMNVYTNARAYSFELQSSETGAGSHNPSYRVNFRYPGEEAAARHAQLKREARVKDFNYYVAGEATGFRPYRVYDDGQRTYFLFAADAPRPAIFAANAQGREAIVSARQDGNTIVVERTSPYWTLRLGEEELCVAHGDVIRSVPGGRRAALVEGGFR